ncbi:MAG: carboxypeptidase-like regulatory domain-containing protein, partial [Chitinophagaceae bacterium]|nr:carboxypeptidase-like regulatory domain-containing protein [Chitinophagaceae bacterium]
MNLKFVLLLLLGISLFSKINAQQNTTGVVTDKDKKPIPGASISIKGKNSGIVTDENGAFSIPVSDNKENITLIISAVGYQQQQVNVKPGEAVTVSLSLQNTNNLGEVVIVGYQKQSLK